MYQIRFNWICSWEILTEKATSLTPPPPQSPASSMGLGGVRDVALPLCSQTLKIMCLFKTNKHELIDPKGPENIICTMMKYGETFRADTQHLAPPAMTIIKFWKKAIL